METSLEKNKQKIKELVPSQDVLTFDFCSEHGRQFCAIYADGLPNKLWLGELVIKPLRIVKQTDKPERIAKLLASPEFKQVETYAQAVEEIVEGNALLLCEGCPQLWIAGVKLPPGRSVAEPPTQVAVKGPREGFTEDIKVNLGLVRKRLKNPNLMVKNIKVGKQTQTNVSICYLSNVAKPELAKKIEAQILANEIDVIPDSSYISALLSGKPRSLFKRWGTQEKPDVFCAKLAEGRVGILVDGSPIALTVPYMIIEDFQAAEDYYSNNHRASVLRLIRMFAVLIGTLLPAVYVAAQLYKIQIIPFKLLLKISSSVAGIPLTPSVEMFLILFVLEVLNEASIRMPKYVGLALSIVGALVLGETAVRAGIISTPAVIIVAFSAICLYVVPDLLETTAVLRWVFLIVAGSLGTFGVVLAAAFVLCYLVTEQSYGVPLVAPFSPMILRDMQDGAARMNLLSLKKRPKAFGLKNKTRVKEKV